MAVQVVVALNAVVELNAKIGMKIPRKPVKKVPNLVAAAAAQV